MIFLLFTLICSLQALHADTPNYSAEQLKQQEIILLKEWHQQKNQIAQVLRRLRKTRPLPSRFMILSPQNIKDIVHQNLAIRFLDDFFKKSHNQIVKLCNDIIQVRQYLKMVN